MSLQHLTVNERVRPYAGPSLCLPVPVLPSPDWGERRAARRACCFLVLLAYPTGLWSLAGCPSAGVL